MLWEAVIHDPAEPFLSGRNFIKGSPSPDTLAGCNHYRTPRLSWLSSVRRMHGREQAAHQLAAPEEVLRLMGHKSK